MLEIHRLLNKPKSPVKTEATWQVARLELDQATGERLNVGIVVTSESRTVAYRFLQNLSALRCLYNADQFEDAAFLIDQAEQCLESGQRLPEGWNITLSEPLFARGASLQAIADELYQRLVPLAAREQREEHLDNDDHPHATRNVKATVRKLLAKHLHIKESPEWWHSRPVLQTVSGRSIRAEIQVLAPSPAGLITGTVASAWYKTEYHRNASLDKAIAAALTAAKLFPSATNRVYLLEPTLADGFNAGEIETIQASIESVRYLAQDQKADVAVFSTERAIAQRILEDVGAL